MLRGTLDDFSLPDVFRLLSLARKTGRLDVERKAGGGKVFFRGGDVYFAESSLSREPLGQKLIRSGALTEGALRRALDRHATTGERVGEILVGTGIVTKEQIELALRQQIEDSIFDLLRWELGEFVWEADAELDVEVEFSVSVENLIMEASRRLDELEVIKRKIPSMDVVLAMAPKPPEGAPEINITPEEWRVLVLVDGERVLHDIARIVGMDEFGIMRTMYGLASAGLVEVVGAGVEGDGDDADADDAADAASYAHDYHEDPVEAAAPQDAPQGVTDAAGEPPVAGPTPPAPEVPAAGSTAGVPDPLSDPFDDLVFEPGIDETPSEDWFIDPVIDPVDDPVAPAEAEAAGETPSEDWFIDPVDDPVAPAVGEDVAADLVDADATHADPFLGDIFDDDIPQERVPAAAAPPATPPAAPTVDRAAVVRELAGLFDDGRVRPARAEATARPQTDGPEDERKRVEDDDQITRGLISRLIDGVKGL